MTGDLFLNLVHQSLYSAEMISSLPELIDSTRKGDYSLVELLIGYFELLDTFVSSGMYISVQCTEDAPLVSEEDAEAALAAHPDIRGAFFGEPQLSAEPCRDLGRAAGGRSGGRGSGERRAGAGVGRGIHPPGGGGRSAGGHTT